MGKHCAAIGCTNTSKKLKTRTLKDGVTFHSFPLKQPDILQIWVHQIRRENFTPTPYSFLCSEHFNENHFKYQPFTGTRMIRRGAIPTNRLFTQDHQSFPKGVPHNRLDCQHQSTKPIINRQSQGVPLNNNNDKKNIDKARRPWEEKSEEISYACVVKREHSLEVEVFEKEVHGYNAVVDKRLSETTTTAKSEPLHTVDGGLLSFNAKPGISSLISAFVKTEEASRHTVKDGDGSPEMCDEVLTFAPKSVTFRKENEQDDRILNGYGKGTPIFGTDIASIPAFFDYAKQVDEIIDQQYKPNTDITNDDPQYSETIHDKMRERRQMDMIIIQKGEKPYVCRKCGMTFSLKSTLHRHVVESHIEQKQKDISTHANAAFSEISRSDSKGLNRSHTHKKIDRISNCENIAQKSDVQTAMESLTQQIPKCSICNKMFSDISILTRHMKFHSKEKPKLICSVCNKAFISESHLRLHMRTHTGEKPYLCSTCGMGCATKGNLKAHIRTHTGEKPFKCSTCGWAFSVKAALQRHEESSNCRKSPLLLSHQQTHLRTHSEEVLNYKSKRYECPTCGNSFSRKGSLQAHVRTHTHSRDKPFECLACGKLFFRKSYLKNHMRIHTGEKPYKCSFCGLAFARNHVLKSHTFIHTGEKPYDCSTCGKAFSQLSSLNKHMKVHPNI